jgi:hypothetical protein
MSEEGMQERVTGKSVTFLKPFSLGGVDGKQAAGTYVIETTEVPIDGVSFLAYRRVSTTITLPALGTASLSRQVITIDPADLEAALQRDASAAEIRPDGG